MTEQAMTKPISKNIITTKLHNDEFSLGVRSSGYRSTLRRLVDPSTHVCWSRWSWWTPLRTDGCDDENLRSTRRRPRTPVRPTKPNKAQQSPSPKVQVVKNSLKFEGQNDPKRPAGRSQSGGAGQTAGPLGRACGIRQVPYKFGSLPITHTPPFCLFRWFFLVWCSFQSWYVSFFW